MADLAWLGQELSKGILAWRHQKYKGNKKKINKREKKNIQTKQGRLFLKQQDLDAGKRWEVFYSVPVQHFAKCNPKLQLSSCSCYPANIKKQQPSMGNRQGARFAKVFKCVKTQGDIYLQMLVEALFPTEAKGH